MNENQTQAPYTDITPADLTRVTRSILCLYDYEFLDWADTEGVIDSSFWFLCEYLHHKGYREKIGLENIEEVRPFFTHYFEIEEEYDYAV